MTDSTLKSNDPDRPVLSKIQALVTEEHGLYEQGERVALSDGDRLRLAQIQVELDQCWDLLRQRRALRHAGSDPDLAQLRSSQMVENYEQS